MISVMFLQYVMIYFAMIYAGVGPMCFIKLKASRAIQQDISALHAFTFTDKVHASSIFLFQLHRPTEEKLLLSCLLLLL